MPFPKAQPRPDIDWLLLRKLCEQDGVSLSDLAIRFNLAPSTLSWHAKKEGWDRSAGRAAASLSKAVANGKPLRCQSGHLIVKRGTQAVLTQFGANQITSKLNASNAVAKALRKFASMQPELIIGQAREFKCIVEAANILFHWQDPKQARNGSRSGTNAVNLLDLTPDQLAKLAAIEVAVNPIPSLDSPSSQNIGTPEEPKRD
jgi:hypothetical protein